MIKLVSFFLFNLLFTSYVFAQAQSAYYRYEGKLGPRDAVMEIALRVPFKTQAEIEIEPVTAYYYYKDDGIPMLLYKAKENKGKDIVLHSWSDETQERFEVTYDDKGLSGRWYWTETDEGEPIELIAKKLSKDEGFSFHSNHKVVQEELNTSNETLEGLVYFSAFLPNNKKIQSDFIAFATENGYKDFNEYSNAEIIAFEKQYKDAVQQFIENGDAEYTESMNHFAVYNICPVLNSDDYLIMIQSVYSYFGGAHGMNTEQYYNFDKKRKKWLSLYDVLDQKKETDIQKIIGKELRRQYQIPDDVKLSEAKESDFLVEEVPITDNFTISKHHITFHYQPYEVAPYAAGMFELKVPLENFKSVLKN